MNGPAPMFRDLPFEREQTRAAGAVVQLDPEGLIAFSEARAHPGPVLGLPGRDLVTEGLEELADCRNYTVWRLTELRMNGRQDPLVRFALDAALAHIVAAYDRLAAARLREAVL